jgi:hypothetical protein
MTFFWKSYSIAINNYSVHALKLITATPQSTKTLTNNREVANWDTLTTRAVPVAKLNL